MGKKTLIILGVVVVAGAAGWFAYQSQMQGTVEGTEGLQTQPMTEIPNPQPEAPKTNMSPDLTADASGLSKATVVLNTTQGVIKYKFYPKEAPETVKRMIELVNSGFYNGLSFHRVIPGFVAQGGDPKGDGTGGSGQKLKAEFNRRRHVEGTMAMARAADPDSADAQFYITLAPQPHLDDKYTVFGQVVEGMELAHKLQVGDKMSSVVIE